MMGLILLFFDGVSRGFRPENLPPLAAAFLYGSIFLVVSGSIAIAVAIRLD